MTTLIAVLAAFFFACSGVVIRYLGGNISAWEIMLLECVAFFSVCWIGAKLTKVPLFPKDIKWGSLLIISRVGVILSMILALKTIDISNYYLIFYTFTIWTLIFGGLLLKEIPRKLHLLGGVICIIGLFIVYNKGGLNWGWGSFFALVCSICIAGQIVLARKLKKESFFTLGASCAAAGTIVATLGVVTFVDTATIYQNITLNLWPLLGLMIFKTLAPLCALYAQQRIRSFTYALIGYIQIPMGIIGAWLFLGEGITRTVTIGLIVVVAGSLASRIPSKETNIESKAIKATSP